MTVSIIIAVKTWQKNLEECVARCLELDYPDFEIIILPDNAFPARLPHQGLPNTAQMAIPINIIPTGPLKPADKRDIGVKSARGEIIAFIDDDAYPEKSWLKAAVKNFSEPQVAAVGGPAVTPESDDLMQQVSGGIYSSLMVSGNFVYRYIPKARREADDLPSCNFIVRKDVILELGGFNTSFWPGEDTKLCLDIVHKLNKKIIYDPEVLVYHHRRRMFKEHFKQIANYALHRGHFVKKFPQTSLRISYFIPSIFVAGLALGPIIGLFFRPLFFFYLFCVFLYLILDLVSVLHSVYLNKSYFMAKKSRLLQLITFVFMFFCGIIMTHVAYGLFFFKGLISKKINYR